MGLQIVKGFVKDRFDRTTDTRQVSPLSCGREVWVLARGNDHRGGTWFDPDERVVWLLAYRLHRSGVPNDFFPYCKELDRQGALLPTSEDYERFLRDRGARFAFAVSIEAPLILRRARENPGEHRVMLGGEFGACIAIEHADELESTVLAFRVETVPFDYVPLILAAFHPDSRWEPATAMPSRPLEASEFAFEHLHERE